MIETLDAVLKSCWEFWGIEDPDPVEAYHAYRLIEKDTVPYEEFRLAWLRYAESRG